MNKQTTPADSGLSRAHRRTEKKDGTGQYPSRSEIHKSKKRENEGKKKIQLKYPLISLLALCFILLPILLLSVTYYYGKDGNVLDDGQMKDYESIIIDNDGEEVPQEEVNSDSGEGAASPEQNGPEDAKAAAAKAEEEEEKRKEAERQEKQQEEIRKQKEAEQKLAEQQKQKEAQALAEQKKREEAEQKLAKQQQEAEQKAAASKKEEAKPKTAGKVVKHTVKPEENLFRISMKYYSSREGEAIIKEYNHLPENDVYEGQVLEIPLKQ